MIGLGMPDGEFDRLAGGASARCAAWQSATRTCRRGSPALPRAVRHHAPAAKVNDGSGGLGTDALLDKRVPSVDLLGRKSHLPLDQLLALAVLDLQLCDLFAQMSSIAKMRSG